MELHAGVMLGGFLTVPADLVERVSKDDHTGPQTPRRTLRRDVPLRWRRADDPQTRKIV